MTINNIRLTPDRYNNETEGYKEKMPIDVDIVKKVLSNLENEECHAIPTLFPCCLNHQYKKRIRKKGKRFNEGSFFLEWLESEFRFSNIEVEYIIRYLDPWDREPGDSPTFEAYRGDIREYFRVPKIYKKMSDFIQTYLPQSKMDFDPIRIKMKIWRLRKSGIISELAKEIGNERLKKCPHSPYKQAMWKQNWDVIKLAQKIAVYVEKQSGNEITRRDLMRHFNIKIEDLARIGVTDVKRKEHTGLLGNFGIKARRGGYRNKTVVYYSTTKKASGRYWSMGK